MRVTKFTLLNLNLTDIYAFFPLGRKLLLRMLS